MYRSFTKLHMHAHQNLPKTSIWQIFRCSFNGSLLWSKISKIYGNNTSISLAGRIRKSRPWLFFVLSLYVCASMQNIAEGKLLELGCIFHSSILNDYLLLSLPFLGILLWMLQLSSSRREGGRKKRYIRKEIEIAKKVR